jgi:lipopolysaccharide export system protein LptA
MADLTPGLMTVVRRKTFLIAAALLLFLVISRTHRDPAFAQNEPEPEETPIEQPQAEPTEFTPVTAGDAERGAPSAEASTSASAENTPVAASSPAEASSPVEESSPQATPVAKSTAKPSHHSHATEPAHTTGAGSKTSTAGAGPNVVPANSPFAGFNFGNQKGPTNITSDTGNLDYQNKLVLFTGHVHAVQAGGDLTSDKLRVQYGQDFNDIRMMYADGNVRMSQGTQWITSDHAVLDQSIHILTFYGNPVAHDQKDQITGSTIKVDLVSGKSTVDKPRVIIFPREGKNPDNVDAPDKP